MLEELYKAFCNRCIQYYWDENVNLLEKIGYNEMENIKGRLSNIIKNIKKQIIEKPDDPFAIATYVCKYLYNILCILCRKSKTQCVRI